MEADARQPEGQMTFAEYRRRVVSDERIGRGRELLVAASRSAGSGPGALRRAAAR